MTLQFQPKPGQVVMCDFRGYVLPEMVKVRPVVVLVRNRRNRQLVTVIPLSTTPPDRIDDCHHELSTNPLPGREEVKCWAKCDMVATVSLSRLDRFKVERRKYVAPILSEEDFNAIGRATISGLGLRRFAA